MINRLFFERVDIRYVALLRIVIGIWFFVDYAGMLIIDRVGEAYVRAQMHFPFYGFEWVKPLPGWAMYAVFTIMTLCAVAIAIGYRYKLSVLIFLVLQLYVFMIDIVYTLNKFYLFMLLALVLLFIPADKFWSWRVKKKSEDKQETVPRWMLLVFQLFLALIYFYSGLSKLNYDWLVSHQPLMNHLSRKWPFELFQNDGQNVVIALMSYGGVFFDLTIPFWLTFRKTRWFGHIYQICFHLLNFFLLGIGSLSIFMIILTFLLFPPSSLERRLGLQEYQGVFELGLARKRLIVSSFSLFLLLNLLIPHRHYLIDNDVNWTEKGHRFSWRLMTRTKLGSASTFFVTDNVSKQVWTVNPLDYLTGRQFRKMSSETDLVIVFAHWLEEEWRRKGFHDTKVTGSVRTRLNRRKVQNLVDPELDLTKVQRSVWTDTVSTRLTR